MGMHAVALLKLSAVEVSESLRAQQGTGSSSVEGKPPPVLALDDGCLVKRIARFDAEPDELREQLHRHLGEALARHQDSRGIYVLPDVARPTARTYEGVIEELGEVGFWVPREREDRGREAGAAGAQPVPLDDAVQQLMAGLGPDAMAEIERAVATGSPQALQELARQVGGALGDRDDLDAGTQAALTDALERAQDLLAGADARMAVGGAASTATAPLPGRLGGDLLALAETARQQLASLGETERQQVATLARQLGLPIGDPADLLAVLAELAPTTPARPDHPAAAGHPPTDSDAEDGSDETS